MKILNWIALVLLIIGGLNWGLVGIIGFNLVVYLFGSIMILPPIIYTLVGISAVYVIFLAKKLA